MLVFYSLICISLIIYYIILKIKEEYAINLVLGMTEAQIIKDFFIEIFVCSILSFLISFTGILWYMYGYEFSIPTLAYYARFFIVFLATIFILLLSLLIPFVYFKRNNIASLLKYYE